MITDRGCRVVIGYIEIVILVVVVGSSVVEVVIIIGIVVGKVGANLIDAASGCRQVRRNLIDIRNGENIVSIIEVVRIVCFDFMIGWFGDCFNLRELFVPRLLSNGCM